MRSKRKSLKDILPRLEQLLARTHHFNGLHIEALDGFITALICTRSRYSILDYLPLVMGKTAHPDIYSQKEWKEFQDLLLALMEYRVDNFRKMDLIIRPDGEGNVTGQRWATGFMHYSRFEKSWDNIESEYFWDALGVVFCLGLGITLPEDMSKSTPLTREETEYFLGELRQAIHIIFAYLYENDIQAVQPPDPEAIWDKLFQSHYIEASNAVH